MRVPDAFAAIWLALGSYRLWRLAADDSILDGARDRIVKGRPKLDEFIACPWCSGFWIGGIAWSCWWWWPTVTLACLTPFCVNSLVGTAAHTLRNPMK